MFDFFLAVLAVSAKPQVINGFFFRAEMALGSIIGGGVLLFYYIQKYRTGNWNKKDGRTMASIFVVLFMFVFVLLIVKY